MLSSYIVGALGIAALAVGWLAVQRAWARAFPDALGDPDVLARRGGCGGDGRGGCGCTTVCLWQTEEETP